MNTDKSSMREYTWDPAFYNEIIKDWNYRFPKFSYSQYPKYGKEDNNKWLNFHGSHLHLVGLL